MTERIARRALENHGNDKAKMIHLRCSKEQRSASVNRRATRQDFLASLIRWALATISSATKRAPAVALSASGPAAISPPMSNMRSLMPHRHGPVSLPNLLEHARAVAIPLSSGTCVLSWSIASPSILTGC